jgi:FAD/FMN-containing dehydrogenase
MAVAAVESLKAAFKDQITLPDAASTFEAETNTPWSLSCRQTPAAFVQLQTAEEVSKALSIVKETGCKFAVRTSGHNPNPGFSSTDESGVVLDLRRLKTRELLDDGTARCGAGNTWGDVYTWLEEQKLSAIGGRDCSVGLAGFLLGGMSHEVLGVAMSYLFTTTQEISSKALTRVT